MFTKHECKASKLQIFCGFLEAGDKNAPSVVSASWNQTFITGDEKWVLYKNSFSKRKYLDVEETPEPTLKLAFTEGMSCKTQRSTLTEVQSLISLW